MSAHLHFLTRWEIERLFRVGLGPTGHRRLLGELGRCAACAAHYRKHTLLERALCAKADVPSPFALERLEAMVLDAAHSTSRSTPAERAASFRASFARPPSWAVALAGAVAVLALFLGRKPVERVNLAPTAQLAEVPLVARGSSTRAHEAADVGIRVLRVSNDAGRVDETTALSKQDVITFTYTNVAARVRYLALFGVQAEGALHWYYPGEGEARSIPIRSEVVDEPLGDGFRLAPRHVGGLLRITGVFSAQPIDKSTIERAIHSSSAWQTARDLPLSALPLDQPDVLEHSLLLDLGPTE